MCCNLLQAIKRSVKMLDLIYPYETYKIGVLYVGVGQVSTCIPVLLTPHINFSSVTGNPQ